MDPLWMHKRLIRTIREAMHGFDDIDDEPQQQYQQEEEPQDTLFDRFAQALRAKAAQVKVWLSGPAAQALGLTVIGGVAAYVLASASSYSAVGVVGVGGVGVGAAVGSVALVLGAIIGLAVFGLVSVLRGRSY